MQKAQLEEQKDSSQNSEAADSMRMLQEVRGGMKLRRGGGKRVVKINVKILLYFVNLYEI